ncbi:hypothetical protein YIM_24905 [Amycolatopsis sp. YIM 10]|nr:hypothetical protein YIM_24905 [Amycolatopsis sp. YIM 10]
MIASELLSPFKGVSLPMRPLPLRIRPSSTRPSTPTSRGWPPPTVTPSTCSETTSRMEVPPAAVLGLSGRPGRAMRYAMIGRPRPGIHAGTKCRSCTRAMGIEPPVMVWRRMEDVLCHRHNRWPGQQRDVDLSDHSKVVQANKVHRRLIRKLGRSRVVPAFAAAQEIVDEWVDRRGYRTEYDRRMHRFHGLEWKVSLDDPTILISKYPQTIGLTRLLAVPYWKSLALENPHGSPAFVEEVRRTVEPQYTWDRYSRYRYYEPLVRWFLDEREHLRDPPWWQRPVELDAFAADEGHEIRQVAQVNGLELCQPS